MKTADSVNRFHIAPSTMLMEPPLIPLIIRRKTAARPVSAAGTLGVATAEVKETASNYGG
jgi:hypothetical protein